MSDLITEEDLERARTDPLFRQQMLAKNLDRLLGALNRIRRGGTPDPEGERQIEEGADLAVKLADRLQKGGPEAA